MTLKHISDGSLKLVLPDLELPNMTIYALYPSSKRQPPAVRAFLDFLVERLAVMHW